MGNNGGKYNINKIKKIFTWEEKPTKRKIMGGMKAITKKGENKIFKYNTQLVSITDLIFGDRIICTVGYLCKQQKPCMVRK